MTEQEEIRLLFRILAMDDGMGHPSLLTVLGQADWESLYSLAERHNLEALVFFHLKAKGCEERLSPQVMEHWHRQYHLQSARNLRLFHELGLALKSLTDAGLPVMALKGAYLAASVYPNTALRGMADIDLLMHPQDLTQALQILNGLGYSHILPPWANVDYHAVLAAPARSTMIEVHWELTHSSQPCQIPVEGIWQRAVPVDLADSRVLAMSPEDLLLHVCEHAANKHLFMNGIRSLVDIDRSVRTFQGSLDWQQVALRSEAWGLQRGAGLALSLCQSFLATPIPRDIMEALGADQIPPGIFEDAFVQLLGFSGNHTDEIPAALKHIRTEANLVKKAGLFLHYLLMIPEMPYQHPDEMGWFEKAYFITRRIFYLTGRYGLGQIQALLKPKGSKIQAGRETALLRWFQS